MRRKPNVYIVAGPNGAGKTTFSMKFFSGIAEMDFINADLIARGVSPLNPDSVAIKAGRIFLARIHELMRQKKDFAFETTLSGRGYAPLIQRWQAAGYRVHLVFLRLPSVDVAVERVAARVAQGGHDIPPQVIARRFVKGWQNFEQLYRGLVDTWQVFDNSGELAMLLEEGER